MAKSRRKKKKIKRIIILILTMILLIALIILGPKIVKISQMYKEAKTLVNSSTVSTFMETQTTIIYDSNQNELCTMKNSKDLYYVSISQIPNTLSKSFIVMEDKNFYKHSGFDIKAIARAIIANQKADQISQGGSTITQQLAKNIFLTQEVTWERKVEEIFIAMQMEKKYSKDQILEFYLNNIYFGNGYYGVEAAARGYFNKSVADLTLKEQAFIAAIPNNPSRYNPLTKYDDTADRANRILDALYDVDEISTMDYNTAKSEEVTLDTPETEEVNDSVVTYARHCATESLMATMGFSFRYNFNDESDYNSYQDRYDTYYTQCQQKLISGGYAIYTSINMDIQEELQKAVDNRLSGFQDVSSEGIYTMQGAATCIDNSTGNVVAIVGSRSQEGNAFGLNRAYQSYRQPGSSIKPLSVYTPYVQLGNGPDTIEVDEPIDGGPENADKTFSGQMTLREAVMRSKNTIAWKIYQEITPKAGCAFLLKMGYKKVWVDKEVAAAALGGFTYGVTTEEMAGAYATLANDGVYRRPTCIVKILNATGKQVINENNRDVRIYEINASRIMTDMLKSVMTDGTGVSANVSDAIIAGKTGTTNSNKDSWFCGYSKYYTTTVWTGYDYPKEMTGGSARVNGIFKDFMTAIHTDLAQTDFPKYSSNGIKQQETQTQTEPQTQPETQTEPETESTTSSLNIQTTQPTGDNTKPSGSATKPTNSGGNGTNPSKPPSTDSQLDHDATPDELQQGGDSDADTSGLGDR